MGSISLLCQRWLVRASAFRRSCFPLGVPNVVQRFSSDTPGDQENSKPPRTKPSYGFSLRGSQKMNIGRVATALREDDMEQKNSLIQEFIEQGELKKAYAEFMGIGRTARSGLSVETLKQMMVVFVQLNNLKEAHGVLRQLHTGGLSPSEAVTVMRDARMPTQGMEKFFLDELGPKGLTRYDISDWLMQVMLASGTPVPREVYEAAIAQQLHENRMSDVRATLASYQQKFNPDSTGFKLLLQAALSTGDVDAAMRLLAEMRSANVHVDEEIYGAFLEHYAATRNFPKVRELYEEMKRRNMSASRDTFHVLIATMGAANNLSVARFYYSEMVRVWGEDGEALILMINACRHCNDLKSEANLWKERAKRISRAAQYRKSAVVSAQPVTPESAAISAFVAYIRDKVGREPEFMVNSVTDHLGNTTHTAHVRLLGPTSPDFSTAVSKGTRQQAIYEAVLVARERIDREGLPESPAHLKQKRQQLLGSRPSSPTTHWDPIQRYQPSSPQSGAQPVSADHAAL
eukprot:TRINITY_DN7446_c0_g1_i1.p1 TRINITY_DN7446_c0_g1~~TRINITY_DN7446_c0_g1_i1.p1  ORF type:complete len:532 (-),score=141.61 TRINITY_DN7446_c0_g1_i1:466-2016(-)